MNVWQYWCSSSYHHHTRTKTEELSWAGEEGREEWLVGGEEGEDENMLDYNGSIDRYVFTFVRLGTNLFAWNLNQDD